MQKYAYLMLFVLFSLAVSQAQDEREIKTNVESVKLYLDGAEVYRKQNVALQAGRNHLVFSGLSPKLYDKTIQISTNKASIRVLSVSSKINFLNRREDTPKIKRLRDSVKIVQTEIDLLRDEKGAYDTEKSMLMNNYKINGKETGNWANELQQSADFFRKRIHEINKKTTALSNRQKEQNRQLFDLKLQLYELNAGREATSEVFLVVESQNATSTDMEIRYIVADAGWSAIYDLEAGDVSKPIGLNYRALAYNNTGIDWKDVNISLSTADPMESATQPKLAIWNLDDYSTQNIDQLANISVDVSVRQNSYNEAQLRFQSQLSLANQQDLSLIQSVLGSDYDPQTDYNTEYYQSYQRNKEQKPKLNQVTLDVPEFAIDFEIKTPYTIPSDRKPYSIDINTHQLDATYKYFAIPKLDKDAFLMAQVVGWEDLNLVSGPVNIYNAGRFLGQSELNIRNISDTLSISLGPDPQVVVTRLKVKGSAKKQLIGSQKKASIAYNITARNNHSKAIEIEILDQVPISNDKDIIISIDERSGAEYEEKIGLLTWRKQIPANKTQTFEFGFSIKYPKDKKVQVQYQRMEKRMSPRYF